MAEPQRKFRLNAKNLFLTWPQNDIDPAEAMTRIMDRFGTDNVSYVCVASEEHEDGSPHIHALVCLKSKTDIKSAGDLDVVTGKHGNYQAAKNVRNTFNYVRKGGKFLEKGIPPVSASEGKFTELAKRLQSGEGLAQLDVTDPGFVLQHKRKIEEYYSFQEMKKLRALHPPPPLVLNIWKTVFEVGFNRDFKQKQYWIHGPPNTGKTTLILDLIQTGFRAFQLPTNNDFTGYDDDSYDLAYIDEFKGQLTTTFLNEWLQGTPMKLNTKYGGVSKRKNLVTFILSNFSPKDAFSKILYQQLQPLEERLHIVYTGT